MSRGPRPLEIRRLRDTIGADCMDCGWELFAATRQEAMQHARDTRHHVHLVVEETTVYDGRDGAS